MPAYDHTQYGCFHWLLYGFAFVLSCAGWFAPHDRLAPYLITGAAFTVIGVLIGVLAGSLHYLRVVDDGDRLLLQFGPLPLLRGSFLYQSMRAVEADRSMFIDGWGIHWLPAAAGPTTSGASTACW
jgi:hypothetical protein